MFGMVFWDVIGSWEFPSGFHIEDAGEAFLMVGKDNNKINTFL